MSDLVWSQVSSVLVFEHFGFDVVDVDSVD